MSTLSTRPAEGSGGVLARLVLGLNGPANELAPENRARHLIADMKAPAATLEALPVDDRQGCRAGADDDRAAVLAAERAGPRDVDVVEHPHLGERPRAGLEFVACRWQPTACHAEAGVSIGGLGVVDARLGEDFPGALHDRAEGRLPGLDLQVGTAAIRFPEGAQIGVGEPHAAIGAAAVDAEVKPSHAGAPLLCKRSTCSFRRGP